MKELDLLGVQLMLALRFQQSGFDPSLSLEDEVENATVAAKDLFSEQDGRWFMRSDSIPGHLGLKAIAVDGDGLYLETSRLIEGEIQKVIVGQMLAFTYDPARGFVDTTTGSIVISLSAPAKPTGGEELDERCLWTIQTSELDPVRTEWAIRMADIVYSIDAYEVSNAADVDAGPVTSMASAQRVTMQLQLGLQQRLQLEQRPILSLRGKQVATVVATTELQQIMALNYQLRRMGPAELLEFFTRYVAEHGEKKALNVAIFALAGKVKAAKPELTWREARRMARKLVHQVA